MQYQIIVKPHDYDNELSYVINAENNEQLSIVIKHETRQILAITLK